MSEELLPPVRTATCLAGGGARPPEDCGGLWGYWELLAILADPQHAEYRERLDWAGGPIDAPTFDPTEASEALRGLG